jgi:hypothetical protein
MAVTIDVPFQVPIAAGGMSAWNEARCGTDALTDSPGLSLDSWRLGRREILLLRLGWQGREAAVVISAVTLRLSKRSVLPSSEEPTPRSR